MEKKEQVRSLLYVCAGVDLQEATTARMEAERPNAGGPMEPITDMVKLRRCIDYIVDTYGERVVLDSARGVGYYVRVEDYCCGHPIFMLGTFAVLLLAGAKLFVEFEDIEDEWEGFEMFSGVGFLQRLIELVPGAERVLQEERYSRKIAVPELVHQHPDIRHMVLLGNCANSYPEYKIGEKLGLTIHHPGAHVIVAEYMEDDHCERDQALCEFGRQCDRGLIDYEAYHGSRNQVEGIYAGFDFGDLFWGFEETAEAWASYQVPKDKRTVVYFTDRPTKNIVMPVETARHCHVVFGKELDWRYPQYDFVQLLLGGFVAQW